MIFYLRKVKTFWSLFLVLACALSPLHAQQFSANGSISFTSDAPLELIQAESKSVKGLVDLKKQTFAFSVASSTFNGFNNALQQEHFNENYLESSLYPNSTFRGKFLDPLPVDLQGVHTVRAKGILSIHGVEQERIIQCTLEVNKNSLSLKANFQVLLEDHNIAIPRVVYKKIAEEIQVQTTLQLKAK